jgi:hypothetical protein
LREDIRAVGNPRDDVEFIVFHHRQSEMTEAAKILLAKATPAEAVRYSHEILAMVVSREEARRVLGEYP